MGSQALPPGCLTWIGCILAAMSLLFDSFWRAIAYCMHPRVIALSFLPLILMVVLSFGLGYFFWENAVASVTAWLEAFDLIQMFLGWLGAPRPGLVAHRVCTAAGAGAGHAGDRAVVPVAGGHVHDASHGGAGRRSAALPQPGAQAWRVSAGERASCGRSARRCWRCWR